jgi:hypothetical protein
MDWVGALEEVLYLVEELERAQNEELNKQDNDTDGPGEKDAYDHEGDEPQPMMYRLRDLNDPLHWHWHQFFLDSRTVPNPFVISNKTNGLKKSWLCFISAPAGIVSALIGFELYFLTAHNLAFPPLDASSAFTASSITFIASTNLFSCNLGATTCTQSGVPK